MHIQGIRMQKARKTRKLWLIFENVVRSSFARAGLVNILLQFTELKLQPENGLTNPSFASSSRVFIFRRDLFSLVILAKVNCLNGYVHALLKVYGFITTLAQDLEPNLVETRLAYTSTSLTLQVIMTATKLGHM